MRHLTEGELRRYYDDPDAIVATERSHFASCTVCQDRLHAVASDAKRVHSLLETAPAPVDAGTALTRFHAHQGKAGRRRGGLRLGRPALRWQMPAAGAALAVVVIAMFTVTPFAASLRGLFVPTSVQPVTLSQSDLQSLAPLHNYGTVSVPVKSTESPAADATAAASTSGLPTLQIGNVPSSVAGQPTSYETLSQGTVSFTFSAAKAAAAAQKAGDAAPSFPAGVDGSSLVVQTGPGEGVLYGNRQQIQQALQQSQGSGNASYQQAAEAAGTFMVAGEMRAPNISSTGASVDQIKQTLLSQPGLTPQAKALIQQLGNPDGALPLPIPAGLATAQPVTVQGVQGQAFGDNTGIGS
ncbi:MAG: hypothetical protein J2P38_09590, partial [Candidatus Dormibacteraeota bacterium]|nr:hypothetical protein [Candidatus Dormibacteraeota bacterium]